MKKMSKILIAIVSVILVVGCAFSAFATSVNQGNSERKKPDTAKKSNTEMVIGKIESISAESITIEVATRNKREKKDMLDAGTNTERKKPTDEDKYTLTGEKKTYNIASANFGKKPDKTETTDNTKEKSLGVAMTYADYSVGDYIRITVNKDTPTVAKRIRNANQGFNTNNINKVKGNYTGGYKGSYTGKTKTEKQAN